MKLLLTTALLVTPALLSAQTAMPVEPYPGPVFNELKAYLALTDAQVQSLQSVQNTWNQAQQAIYTQISDKYQQVYTLLNSGNGTAVQIGQLMLDIQALQKQLPVSNGPFKTQALAVLTPDQKTKLGGLAQALQLDTPAWQAVSLLLIDAPAPIGRPVPFTGIGGSIGGCVGIASPAVPPIPTDSGSGTGASTAPGMPNVMSPLRSAIAR